MLTPTQAVDATEQRYGAEGGARRLHARRTLCRGTFTPTAAAAELTDGVKRRAGSSRLAKLEGTRGAG